MRLQGRNYYPASLSSDYYLLTNGKQDSRHGLQETGGISDGVSFHNIDDDNVALVYNAEKVRTKEKSKAHITCHRCQKKGHYANECLEDHSQASLATNQATTLRTILSAESTSLLLDGLHSGEFESQVQFQFLINGLVDRPDGVALQMGHDGCLPQSWILLDNQSTVDVLHNKTMTCNI
jgi:hypothetical protein